MPCARRNWRDRVWRRGSTSTRRFVLFWWLYRSLAFLSTPVPLAVCDGSRGFCARRLGLLIRSHCACWTLNSFVQMPCCSECCDWQQAGKAADRVATGLGNQELLEEVGVLRRFCICVARLPPSEICPAVADVAGCL
jgi:hypothetical protein